MHASRCCESPPAQGQVDVKLVDCQRLDCYCNLGASQPQQRCQFCGWQLHSCFHYHLFWPRSRVPVQHPQAVSTSVPRSVCLLCSVLMAARQHLSWHSKKLLCITASVLPPQVGGPAACVPARRRLRRHPDSGSSVLQPHLGQQAVAAACRRLPHAEDGVVAGGAVPRRHLLHAGAAAAARRHRLVLLGRARGVVGPAIRHVRLQPVRRCRRPRARHQRHNRRCLRHAPRSAVCSGGKQGHAGHRSMRAPIGRTTAEPAVPRIGPPRMQQ